MEGVVEVGLVTIPAGRVAVTDRVTRTRRPVVVNSYELATLPTTQESYARVTGLWPSVTHGARLPVETVSWWDAVHYCNALSDLAGLTPVYRIGAWDTVARDHAANGFRLPTEAEWEHACRAGTGGPRYGPLDEVAWYRGNSAERPRAVGGKRPNDWGLHDMLGNVWEWCWDTDGGVDHPDYRVLRGGGWCDEHWSCRASVRRRSHPTLRLDDIGFRVARSRPTGDGDAEPPGHVPYASS
ncbi:formylglycine-generating enzyme family protein [Saccharomonospora iraqiensis]|uniref:formylglycine-generating enzyme family protein n=1 Tax=Saccharomonospora iraqiensis TaxID=52698 RepID=UPI00069733BB|nr:SUMF1/EgtB/PvdO family nonheme iron enzyme [Saccharomonospora iraqiensis]